MGRGFLSGILWGGIVGLGLLLVSTQTMDRQQLSFPKPEPTAVEVPGGSEFDQARPESEPVLPVIEETPDADEIVAGVLPPEDVVDAPPAFDTSALEMPKPSVVSPESLGDAPEVTEDVDVPAAADTGRVGSEGNAASAPGSPSLEAPETPIAAPETDTVAPAPSEAPGTEGLVVEGSEPSDQAPVVETDIAALPAGVGDNLPSAAADEAPEVVSESEAPASPVSPEISLSPSMPGVVAPETPDVDADVEITAQPQPVAPETPEADVQAEAPAVEVEEPAPVETVEAEPEVAAEPEAPAQEEVAEAEESAPSLLTPVETLEDRASNVEVNRLPTIGGDEGSLPVVRRLPGTPIEEDVAEEDAPEVADEPVAADGPAIEAYAMDFEMPEGAAVVSVVLLQDGDVVLSDQELAEVPASVAFAVDASAPNAAATAKAYRKAGREVVLIPSLPAGAAPQDVEVALGANLDSIPQVVALMDVSGSSFQSDRAAVAQVVAVAEGGGHGVITFPRGLNTAHQQAQRAGLPTGLIFRLLDGGNETDEQIRRTLDRAAFRARQNDAVILVGHARPGTIWAVTSWAEEAGGDVTLAPISRALTR